MSTARERLEAARAAAAAGFPSTAVGAAYYALLYAARAALSEADRNAKTHRGVWSLFGELFVTTGRFDPELVAAAQRARELREAADYEARSVSRDEAETVLAEADRFLSAVTSLLAA